MGFWDAVVLIVLIGAIARVRVAKYGGGDFLDWRKGSWNRRTGWSPHPPEDTNLSRDIAELSRRIAVLERITLEERKKRDIAAEIEALRD